MNNAVPIIPVLVGSARMPQPAQLPESLKNFAFLNAAPVDTGRDFREHMERLIRSIEQISRDRGTTSPAASGWGDEAAPPTGPPRDDQDADPNRLDLSVFCDAAFAPELVVIPAGDFTVGSAEDEEGRYEHQGPRHRVTVIRCFAIGRYPVTFDEYDRFCEAAGREKPADATWGRGRRPVINVSWDHAQAYITWLSQQTSRAYRLPSEAEWEYACRAGTTTRYSFGDAITTGDANYTDSGLGRTREVSAYPPNRWGLRDMHGNVFEWIEDHWHEDYRGAPVDGMAWKEPETSANWHICVLHGGSWNFASGLCRSACCVGLHAEVRQNNIGFRVARTLS